MELRDFFAGNWRALILIPAITAIIAGILFVTSAEERYESTAVITITEYFAADSPAAVRAVIDDFDSALRSRRVIDIVAAEAPNADSYRIVADAVGEGGDVSVTFEAPTRTAVEEALDAGVREALTLTSESVGRQTGRLLVAADAVAADAVSDLQIIEQAAGAADLEAELARRSGDLLALRNQIAAATGNGIVQNSLESTLAAKEAEIAEIEQQLLPWTNARARFDIAVASGADAALALRQIETNEADLQTEELLQSLRTNPVSNVPDLLRVVVAATVVTAGAVVVLSLLVGPGRRRSTRASSSWLRREDTPYSVERGEGLDDWEDWTLEARSDDVHGDHDHDHDPDHDPDYDHDHDHDHDHDDDHDDGDDDHELDHDDGRTGSARTGN